MVTFEEEYSDENSDTNVPELVPISDIPTPAQPNFSEQISPELAAEADAIASTAAQIDSDLSVDSTILDSTLPHAAPAAPSPEPSEVAHKVNSLKTRGNDLVNRREYSRALGVYKEALDLLTQDPSEFTSPLYSNIALCHLRMHNYRECVDASSVVLGIEPSHDRARSRRAEAYYALEDWVAADDDFSALSEDFWSTRTPRDRREMKAQAATSKAKAEVVRKQQLDELLGKAKTLGNKLLGKFGISLDDFAMVKNEDGTMSISMKQR